LFWILTHSAGNCDGSMGPILGVRLVVAIVSCRLNDVLDMGRIEFLVGITLINGRRHIVQNVFGGDGAEERKD
jgi:hypothetical protein